MKRVYVTGGNFPRDNSDVFVSSGILHNVIDPDPICEAAFNALRSMAQTTLWPYGNEGNATYFLLAIPLRVLTR